MFYSIVICDNCYVIHKCRHDDLTYRRNLCTLYSLLLTHMFYSIVICDNCYVIHKCRHDDLTYGRNSHNFLEHSSPLFNQLTILDVFKLHKYLVGVFVYELIHNNLPHSITDYCTLFNYEYNT